tara:strand:- start:2030 stop:2737 length:708 start_codon:yes stop_codon:yes gene_type:complete
MLNNYSLTVLLPVIDEFESLSKTINILETENQKIKLSFIFILHPSKTKQKSIDLCKKYKKKSPNNFSILYQKNQLLGGAYIDGINISESTHILIMSSDLETDPHLVNKMIKESKENKDRIICTSRWKLKKSFKNYGIIKTFLNKIFQSLINVLFNFKLTDYTYGFRIYPTKCLKEFNWKMRNHSFFLEIILLPLKKGYQAIELPAKWNKRKEGISNNKIIYYLSYFKVILLFIKK